MAYRKSAHLGISKRFSLIESTLFRVSHRRAEPKLKKTLRRRRDGDLLSWDEDDDCTSISPHRPWTLGGCWNVKEEKNKEEKTTSLSLHRTTFREANCSSPPPPWTFLTLLFPEAWKHYISQPVTPTGTTARRWKFKGYVLLDSRRQINLNMYFGHGLCVDSVLGDLKWLYDINNTSLACY